MLVNFRAAFLAFLDILQKKKKKNLVLCIFMWLSKILENTFRDFIF